LPAFEEFYRVFCNALNFLSSFLLAHCGGGQDKPGLPWPLSEAPGSVFLFGLLFSVFFLPEFSTRVFHFLLAP